MPSYTHSGTTGDVFSSLAFVRTAGAGEFYLRLKNIDNVTALIGWGAGRHSGRMTKQDFDFLAPIMEIQSCITKFLPWNGEVVDYEFEKSVLLHTTPNWEGWPRNFANQYAVTFGLNLEQHKKTLQVEPYVDVDKPQSIPGRPVCISRNRFYHEGVDDITQVPEWINWLDRGLADQSFFVGLPEDHNWFEETMKVKVHYVPTQDGLELARLIAGSKMMIANQSMPGTLAVGIGTTLWIETRKNVAIDQNEILYPYRSNINYF